MRIRTDVTCLLLFASTSVLAAGSVENAANANPSDVAQAETFLAKLPAACSASHASASSDGTVSIRIVCNGSGDSMDGLVTIKNGVVTNVR